MCEDNWPVVISFDVFMLRKKYACIPFPIPNVTTNITIISIELPHFKFLEHPMVLLPKGFQVSTHCNCYGIFEHSYEQGRGRLMKAQIKQI